MTREIKDKTMEILQMKIKEGCNYSVIGNITLNEHGM